MPDRYLNSLLGNNEEILLTTRQHWFVFVRNILVEGVAIAAIAALVTVGVTQLKDSPWVAFGYLLIIPPFISLFLDFLWWYNRKYIVTSRRVIQISGVINKDVIDSSLEKINDVKLTQSFFGRIFNFGTVEILTASELGVNKFSTLGHPIRFKTSMLNAKEKLEKETGAFMAETKARSDIPGLIAQLDALRQQGVLSEEEFQAKKAYLLSKI